VAAFVDADSLLNPGMAADILQMIETGKYVGCAACNAQLPLVAQPF
jgi:hypothetical protein